MSFVDKKLIMVVVMWEAVFAFNVSVHMSVCLSAAKKPKNYRLDSDVTCCYIYLCVMVNLKLLKVW